MAMNDTKTAFPSPTDLPPADLRASELFGQTRGAMVLIGAGLGWMIGGLSALGAVPLTLFLAVLAVAAVLLLGGWIVRRSASGVAETPWSPQMSRGFWLAFGGEFVAILVIITGGLLLRQSVWIAPLVALAVGLHFLPLAYLFRRPLYYITGAALCLVCLMTITFVPPHWGVHHFNGWLLAAGVGSGAVLWLSALGMLIQSGMGLKEYSQLGRQ